MQIFLMLSKSFIRSFDTFVFDLDGTFWWYPKIVDGAKEIYRKLKEMNKKIVFVSNFSILDRDGMVRHLRENGVPVAKDEIITSSYVASKVLKGRKVFPIGNGLEKELRKGGVKIVKSEKCNIVVVGHDTNFNYKKASIALKILLRRNAKLYTTAYGRLWIFKDSLLPGTGLITSSLEYCSGKKAIMLGKPSRYMLEEIRKIVEGKVIYFGDEDEADIGFANEAGFFSVFIRNGVEKRISKNKPKATLKSLKHLLRFL